MQQVPGLSEAPPAHEEPRNGSNLPASPESQSSPGEVKVDVDRHNGSPTSPVRKDTISSNATTATTATIASTDSATTAATALSSIESPTNGNYSQAHAVFSVSEAENAAQPQRRPSRRRTGPLTNEQREKAALIRKLKACSECRRRRVACEPSHHGMSWDEVRRKFRPHSPTLQQLAPLSPSGRRQSPLSTSLLHAAASIYPDSQSMDIDSNQNHQSGRTSLADSRIRTPLPSGPRLDKVTHYTPLPGPDSPKSELQSMASRIVGNPGRGRYKTVQVLLLHWEDDDDLTDVAEAVNQLSNVLSGHYNFKVQRELIPASENCKSPWKWLTSTITHFVGHEDQRDVLKIVYYNGHSYLDADGQMLVASSTNPEAPSARWSGIQQHLEEAISDVVLLMDAAYYPSSTLQAKHGVFEVLAASNAEDVSKTIGRNKFTRALSDWLYHRLSQKNLENISVAEIHARLLPSVFPKIMQEGRTSFPSLLHLQVSADARLPPISLAPLPTATSAYASSYDGGQNGTGAGAQVTFTFQFADNEITAEKWSEFLRWMPDGIKDVKVDGPYRNPNTFR